jgi:serine phosphatase RsbU (regulator of sigma subunit)
MHPILAHPGRLGLYLAAWIPIAGVLATLVAVSGSLGWLEAILLAAPLSLFYAFICLASWYPCRAMQPGKVSLVALASTHLVSAVFSSSMLVGAAYAWHWGLAQSERFTPLPGSFTEVAPWFAAVGIFLYLLAAAAHYLLVTVQASQEAESENLELQVRARDAELRALKAQQEQQMAARELELAREIQRRLLPPGEIQGDGFHLAARNLPAQFVAGDFYDAFELPDGSLALVVADVAGKGMGASLIMASVKAMLPLIAADNSVTDTLGILNAKLVDELAAREFVALALGRFQPDEQRLEIANAGLPDPYHLGSTARAIEVPGTRLPLGVRAGVSYESVVLELAQGERFLMLTDGLPEALTEAGEPLGYEALESLLDHREANSVTWLERLLERLSEVTAEGQEDDITALVFESHPSGATQPTS